MNKIIIYTLFRSAVVVAAEGGCTPVKGGQ
jgi:hypothetical protein